VQLCEVVGWVALRGLGLPLLIGMGGELFSAVRSDGLCLV